MGRGDIRIIMDGGRERKLCDVQHVSDLWTNLLLPKMKDKSGYSTNSGENRCKITKGSLMVAKGKSYGTLYNLCGDIVTNHASTIYSMNVLDAVMLRHQ